MKLWNPLANCYKFLYFIILFLIDFLGIYSPEAVETYKSLDAWKFFRDRWVQTITHKKIPGDIIIMKCEVRPSYKTTSSNHKPWIALGSLGNVLAAHCDCMKF